MIKKPLLHNRNFYFLMGYQLCNGTADKLFQFCIPWFVYDLTGSASQMAMSFGMGVTPYLLFSIIGGAFIDYYNRRKILMICSLLSGATLLLFSLFFLDPSIKVELSAIYALSFLLGTYNALDQPAFDSSIIEYFTKDELVSVNSTVEVILSFCNTVGPLLAGVLITWSGSKIAVTSISFIYLISFLLIKLSKPTQESSRNRSFEDIGQLINENCQLIKEGFSYVFKPSCPLFVLLLMTFLSNIFFSSLDTLVVFLARDTFGLNSENFAFILSGISMLAIPGIAILSKSLKRFNIFSVLIAVLIIESFANISIGTSKTAYLFISFYLATVISNSIYCIYGRSYRQSVVPHALSGRLASITRCISYASAGLGAVLSSFLLKFISTGSFLIFGGIFVFLVVIVSLLLKRKQQSISLQTTL